MNGPKPKLKKISVDLPESLYQLIQNASTVRGEPSDIIRTGAEKEALERLKRRQPNEFEEKAS